MAARPTWKGVLKISLVTIPIKVFPATDTSAVLDFHQLHAECSTRITQRRWCRKCVREVSFAEIVKGYEFEKDKYVVLSETEFDAVKPESAKVIDLVQFADASALDPLYIDRSYYLGPDGERAGEPFAVIGAALRGQVGIGRVSIYGREYLVAVRPALDQGGALLLHTLHHDAEIRSAHELIADVPTTIAPDQIKLAKQLLATFTQPRHKGLPLANFTDTYQADLKKLIEKKIKGEEIIEATPAPAPTSNVVSLKDALTRSLTLVSGAKKPAAKIAPAAERRRKRA